MTTQARLMSVLATLLVAAAIVAVACDSAPDPLRVAHEIPPLYEASCISTEVIGPESCRADWQCVDAGHFTLFCASVDASAIDAGMNDSGDAEVPAKIACACVTDDSVDGGAVGTDPCVDGGLKATARSVCGWQIP